MRGLRSLRL